MKHHVPIDMQHYLGLYQTQNISFFLSFFLLFCLEIWPVRLRFTANSLLYFDIGWGEILPGMLCVRFCHKLRSCCSRKPLPSCCDLSRPKQSLGRGPAWTTMPAGWRRGNVTSTSCLLPGECAVLISVVTVAAAEVQLLRGSGKILLSHNWLICGFKLYDNFIISY